MTTVCSCDMNWIIPGKLAVGNMDSVVDGPRMVREGIKGVVSVRGRLSCPPEYYMKYGINVLHIPVSDSVDTNLGKYFPIVYRFIDKFISNNQSVIVNCYAGISRSTTLVTSYLMRKYRLTSDAAMNKVKIERPCFGPNPGFIRQLKQYELVLKKHNLL